MSNAIEVVTYDQPDRLHELADATWANAEPGFQVEGVISRRELDIVFASITKATPERYKDRAVGFEADLLANSFFTKGTAHIDGGRQGLAIHQNLTHPSSVELGVLTTAEYRDLFFGGFTSFSNNGRLTATDTESARIDPTKVDAIKRGVAEVGMLTVFSEGGFGQAAGDLRPTVHYFDRLGSQAPLSWVRYEQLRSPELLEAERAVMLNHDIARAFDLMTERAA